MTYLYHLIIYFSIYAILALSLNLAVGYCGLLTLAHAAYFAIGGYVYAAFALRCGWGFVPNVFAAAVIGGFISLAISLPAWKFRGEFFVIVSLAVQSLFYSIMYNWSDPTAETGTWRNLTNGPFGIAGIPKPKLFYLSIDSIGAICLLSLAILFIIAITLFRLQRSPWGRLLKCMRDDELALRGLGKNTRLAKLQTFAISCGVAGIAGVMYASYVTYMDPSSADLNESILLLSMVLVGGVGNFTGPLVGALVLLLIPEALRFAQIPDPIAASVRLIFYGIFLVLMVHFRPQGLAGEYRIE